MADDWVRERAERALSSFANLSENTKYLLIDTLADALQEAFERGEHSILDRLRNPDDAMIEALKAAFVRYEVQGTRGDEGLYEIFGPWYLVDTATAEPEVNWPGELVAEYSNGQQAHDEKWRLCIRAIADALDEKDG